MVFIVLNCKLWTRHYLFSALLLSFYDIVTVTIITQLNSIFNIFFVFVPSLYLRCHCCWSVIVLNSIFEQRFLLVLYPLLLFVLWRCHSYHILNIILMYILATSFAVFTLKMASCKYIVLLTKNLFLVLVFCQN